MKVTTTVHKYHRTDGTPVRKHKRNIDVDLFHPSKEVSEPVKTNEEHLEKLDKDLVQGKEDVKKWEQDLEYRPYKDDIKEYHYLIESKGMKPIDARAEVEIKRLSNFTRKPVDVRDIDGTDAELAEAIKKRRKFEKVKAANWDEFNNLVLNKQFYDVELGTGEKLLVDTQGYDYPRYVTRYDKSEKVTKKDALFMKTPKNIWNDEDWED